MELVNSFSNGVVYMGRELLIIRHVNIDRNSVDY